MARVSQKRGIRVIESDTSEESDADLKKETKKPAIEVVQIDSSGDSDDNFDTKDSKTSSPLRATEAARSEIRFKSDLDSLIVVTNSLLAFDIDEKITIPIKLQSAGIETNFKMTDVLNVRLGYNAEDKAGYTWVSFSISENPSLHFLANIKDKGEMRDLRYDFLTNILRKSGSDIEGYSIISNLTNFHADDPKGNLEVYKEDWVKVAQNVDELLNGVNKTSFLADHEIRKYFFYAVTHGNKNTNETALEDLLKKLKVIKSSDHIELIQAHFATVLRHRNDDPLLVRFDRVESALSSVPLSKGVERPISQSNTIKRFKRFFLNDVGNFSVTLFWITEDVAITYIDTYWLINHIIKLIRSGLLTAFVIFGGYEPSLFKKFPKMRSQRDDNLSQIAQFFEFLRRCIDRPDLRIEEVYSAIDYKSLVSLLPKLSEVNRATEILLDASALVKLENWPHYVLDSIQGDLDLLREAMTSAAEHGAANLSKGEVKRVHLAETRLKLWLNARQGHKVDYDHRLAQNLISRKLVPVVNLVEDGDAEGNLDFLWEQDNSEVYQEDSENMEEDGNDEDDDDEYYSNDETLLGGGESSDDISSGDDLDEVQTDGEGPDFDFDIDFSKFTGTLPHLEEYAALVFACLPISTELPEEEGAIEKKINLLLLLLGKFARRFHCGYTDNTSVRTVQSAFEEKNLNRFKKKHKLQAVSIGGSAKAKEISTLIYKPKTLSGKLIASIVRLPDDETTQNALTSFIEENVEVFPMALLHREKFPTYRWYRVSKEGEDYKKTPKTKSDDNGKYKKRKRNNSHLEEYYSRGRKS